MAALRFSRIVTQFCTGSARLCHSTVCNSHSVYYTPLNSHTFTHRLTRSHPHVRSTARTWAHTDVENDITARVPLPQQNRVFDLQVLVSALQQENAVDVCVIKVPEDLKYTQYFIIVSGASPRHLRAMAEYTVTVYKFLKADDDPHTDIEGKECDDWLCIDFGSMVVHFMLPETRERFDLETLWTLRDYENQKHVPPYTLPSDFILTHTLTVTDTH